MNPALALVNSEHWYGRGVEGIKDQLDVPGWLEGFLGSFGPSAERPPTARQKRELVRLRVLLRRVVTDIVRTGNLAAEDLEELNRFIGSEPLTRRVVAEEGSFRVDLVPSRRSWRSILADIATSFAELLERGEPERIKLCANEECAWVFYDESKNRSRRWCGASSCGTADKVRRFRARRRARAA